MENRAKLNHLYNPHNPRGATRNSEIKSRDLNSETLYYFCRAPAICSLVPRTDLCNSLSRTRHLEFGRAPMIYAYPRKRRRLVPVVASFCQSRSGALDNLALTSSAPTPLRDQTGSKTLICSYLAFQHSTLSITSSSPHLEGHLKQALPGRQNRVRTTMPSPSSSPLLSKVLATFTSTLKSRASLHLRGPARRCRSAVRQVPQFSFRTGTPSP
jgi:hypothetical protein